jgi:hypothetical protein
MRYCTYLTAYSGNKLPPFYIGSSSISKIKSGYHRSVLSTEYKEVWKQELALNPHLFVTRIVSLHATREDAFAVEERLQRKLQCVQSPMYINKATASKDFWFRQKHSATSKQLISAKLKRRTISEGHASKIKQSLSGKAKTPEHRVAMSEAWKTREGPSHTQKQKISASMKAVWAERPRKEKIAKPKHDFAGVGNPMFGKKHTPEAIKVMSRAKKGRPMPEEQKLKMRGRKVSEEARQRMKNAVRPKASPEECAARSERMKAVWARRKAGR